MNKEKNLSFSRSAEKHVLSQELQDLTPRNCVTVGRRSFIRCLGNLGATLLPAGALLIRQAKAREQSSGTLTKGDADLLRFAAWAEIVESDLWTQYNELGGATKPNDGPPNVGNPPYKLALQNLDSDMPQYISDNTDDELSHAAFLNAYLGSHGAEPVNLISSGICPVVRRQESINEKLANDSQTCLASTWTLAGILATAAKRTPIWALSSKVRLAF